MKKITFLFLFVSIAYVSIAQTTAVTLNLPNPCSTVITHIEQKAVEKTFDFVISPNPTAGKFVINISSQEALGKLDIYIVNMQGKGVFREQIYSQNSNCVKPIDIAHLTDGIYVVAVIGKDNKMSKKVILLKN